MTMIEKKNVYLLDSAMTHSILKDKRYFSSMTLRKANVHTIFGPVEMIDGSGNATIMLPNGVEPLLILIIPKHSCYEY